MVHFDCLTNHFFVQSPKSLRSVNRQLMTPVDLGIAAAVLDVVGARRSFVMRQSTPKLGFSASQRESLTRTDSSRQTPPKNVIDGRDCAAEKLRRELSRPVDSGEPATDAMAVLIRYRQLRLGTVLVFFSPAWLNSEAEHEFSLSG